MKKTLVLVGKYRDRSRSLNGFKFVRGECEISGTDLYVDKVCSFFEQHGKAVVKSASEVIESDGKHDTESDSDGRPDEQVSGDVRPDGEKPKEKAADDFLATGNAARRLPTGEDVRDGQTYSGLSALEVVKLRKAVMSIDRDASEKWNESGSPKVSVVKSLVPAISLTKQTIDDLCSDLYAE